MTVWSQVMYSAHKLKKRRKRRLFFTVFSLFALLAAGGVLISKAPVSPQGVSEVIQLAGDGLFSPSSPAALINPPLLRGTIYDRNFQELAVSYKLFSLQASPAKISNHIEVAEKLSSLGVKSFQKLLDLLAKPDRVVDLADNLDLAQAENIKSLSIDGLYLRGFEERFFPEHASAVHVTGYISNGIGIAGMERQFDMLLQPGESSAGMAPEVYFQGYTTPGRKGADLVLTIDIGFQKKIDQRLSAIMAEGNADSAMGLLFDPRTGDVLSLSSLPSFDGNYFWNASEEQRKNRVFSPVLSKELIQPILIRAAAIMANGVRRELILPATVATPDFGLDNDALSRVSEELGFLEPVYAAVLPEKETTGRLYEYGNDYLISLAQIGVGMASLINGGWRLTPLFLDSVYDLEKKKSFPLNMQAVTRKLVVSPVMGVVLRRQLFSSTGENGMIAFTGRSVRVVPAGDFSRYIQQEFFGGVVRGENGQSLLLLIVIEKNNLVPSEAEGEKKEKKTLREHGRSLLADLHLLDQEKKVAVRPVFLDKDKDNKTRFLISRKMENIFPVVDAEKLKSEMPLVIGASLREGLQALSRHKCRVIVKGSGRIISQYPPAWQQLQEGDECILSLDANI